MAGTRRVVTPQAIRMEPSGADLARVLMTCPWLYAGIGRGPRGFSPQAGTHEAKALSGLGPSVFSGQGGCERCSLRCPR
jgi:hypothetical protein